MNEKLIEKAKNGDHHAFRIIVKTYQTHIFRAVFAVLQNQKDAEDATQEAFLKIYTSLPSYDDQGFKTWITRIAVNHAIDFKRKIKRYREDLNEEIDLTGNTTTLQTKSAEYDVLKRLKKEHVRERIQDLPINYRDVIIGYYIEEKSYQQLAEEQQVKVKTIETKLYRARQWMRKHWKEEDFT